MRELAGALFIHFSVGDRSHSDVTGTGVFDIVRASRVEKEHQADVPDVVGRLGSKLMQGKNFYLGLGELASKRISNTPSDTVIAA